MESIIEITFLLHKIHILNQSEKVISMIDSIEVASNTIVNIMKHQKSSIRNLYWL